MKLDLRTGLVVLGIVLVTLKFREQFLGFFAKVPVVGPLVA